MSWDRSEVIRQMRADKVKWASLTLCMALGMLLWGRLLLKDVPRVVTATDPTKLSADPLGLGAITTDSRGSIREGAEVEIASPPLIQRDLFRVNPRFYDAIDAGPEKLSKQAKSAPVSVDDGNGLSQRVTREAEALTLQSTLLGASPRALVNGRLLGIGQSLDGFELTEVKARQATFKKDGVWVVLDMKTP
ncbi:MAG: hypothetical protein ACYTGQ_11715 [Planctomycetota bacterium]|jgi:hypothetical protein